MRRRLTWTKRLIAGLEAAVADRWDVAEIARQIGCTQQALWLFRSQQIGIGYEYRRELEQWLMDHGYCPEVRQKRA